MQTMIPAALLTALLLTALPTPEELCKRAAAIENAEDKVRGQYTYREVKREKDFDKKGNVERIRSKTFDCFFLEGQIYRKLILEDEHPLDARTQARVDADRAKERDRRRKEHGAPLHFERHLSTDETSEM